MAGMIEEAYLVLIIAAGAVGVAFYGYSSFRIGERFGMASVVYPAVYFALLASALAPAAAPALDRPTAIVMSVVSWGLYTAALLRSRVVKRHLGLEVAATGLGFIALVVFPVIAPVLFAVLYRGAAVTGWVAGARPGFRNERKKK